MVFFFFCFSKLAYVLTEDAQHRELDGPSTNLALSDIISNALPPEKKDKLTDLNNVSTMTYDILFRMKSFNFFRSVSSEKKVLTKR